MTVPSGVVLLGALCAITLAGAIATVVSREVLRMTLGLGSFLLGLAGLFAYLGFGFLALAELFVYVGGVLVLILFALMLVHRSEGGAPALGLRDVVMPIGASALLGALLFWSLRTASPKLGAVAAGGEPNALAGELLGPLLPQFEIAGALLLVALVAVVVISGGEER